MPQLVTRGRTNAGRDRENHAHVLAEQFVAESVDAWIDAAGSIIVPVSGGDFEKLINRAETEITRGPEPAGEVFAVARRGRVGGAPKNPISARAGGEGSLLELR